MPAPDTLHNLILWLVAGLLFGAALALAQWSVGKLSTTGKAVALVAIIVLAVLLLVGVV